MKTSIIIFVAALVLVLLFSPIALSSQEQETQPITVKSKEVSNGVVVISVQQGERVFELQCNKDLPGCAALDRGQYLMARLPKNRGMYDCANAEVYQKLANAEAGDRIGQYCLVLSK